MFTMYFNVNVKFKGYNQYKYNRIFNYFIRGLFLTNRYLCRLGGGSVPRYYTISDFYLACRISAMYGPRWCLCHLGGGSGPACCIYCGNEPLSDTMVSIITHFYRCLCRLGGGSVPVLPLLPLLCCYRSNESEGPITVLCRFGEGSILRPLLMHYANYETKLKYTNLTNTFVTAMHPFFSNLAPSLVCPILHFNSINHE